MTTLLPTELCETLWGCGQGPLVDQAASWSEAEQQTFARQAAAIDWPLVQTLFRSTQGTAGSSAHDPRELARRATPPERLVRLPSSPTEKALWHQAAERGEAALRDGRVAAILVAGGQGTRLGTTDPKGMFPIGPLSGKPLFRWFAEQLIARQRRYGVRIPYAIMTSDATHDATVADFAAHHFYGLNPDDVWFFCQANMPAVDATTGVALLTAPGRLALSPDGHGGILAAMVKSGVLQRFADRGIDTLYYHQVDNPTTPVCDPAFLGWHLENQAEVSTKVVAKVSGEERMGVAVSVDGRTQIIEYSDFPPEIAAQTEADEQLRFWAGNTAMHVFDRTFLERAAGDAQALPFHVARKAVAHWTAAGEVTPAAPNAIKFERFIFDVLPWAEKALIVEGARAAEFNPVKNRDGNDSPATATTALMALHRQWIRDAGGTIAEDVPVEISPLVALVADDLGQRFGGRTIREPLLLNE
jgi:UDP-N-acetylglucosamine/UDP-N-acetylgalactosamine diphosphorylase